MGRVFGQAINNTIDLKRKGDKSQIFRCLSPSRTRIEYTQYFDDISIFSNISAIFLMFYRLYRLPPISDISDIFVHNINIGSVVARCGII